MDFQGIAFGAEESRQFHNRNGDAYTYTWRKSLAPVADWPIDTVLHHYYLKKQKGAEVSEQVLENTLDFQVNAMGVFAVEEWLEQDVFLRHIYSLYTDDEETELKVGVHTPISRYTVAENWILLVGPAYDWGQQINVRTARGGHHYFERVAHWTWLDEGEDNALIINRISNRIGDHVNLHYLDNTGTITLVATLVAEPNVDLEFFDDGGDFFWVVQDKTLVAHLNLGAFVDDPDSVMSKIPPQLILPLGYQEDEDDAAIKDVVLAMQGNNYGLLGLSPLNWPLGMLWPLPPHCTVLGLDATKQFVVAKRDDTGQFVDLPLGSQKFLRKLMHVVTDGKAGDDVPTHVQGWLEKNS